MIVERQRTRVAEAISRAKADQRVGDQPPVAGLPQRLEGLVALELAVGRGHGRGGGHGAKFRRTAARRCAQHGPPGGQCRGPRSARTARAAPPRSPHTLRTGARGASCRPPAAWCAGGDFVYVIGDDELNLAVFEMSGGAPGRLERALDGGLPVDSAARKAASRPGGADRASAVQTSIRTERCSDWARARPTPAIGGSCGASDPMADWWGGPRRWTSLRSATAPSGKPRGPQRRGRGRDGRAALAAPAG